MAILETCLYYYLFVIVAYPSVSTSIFYVNFFSQYLILPHSFLQIVLTRTCYLHYS
jgi:hypothetical protein